MKTTKVLFITSVFPDMRSGIADYSFRLLKHIHPEAAEFHVLTSEDRRIVETAGFCKIYPAVKSWTLKDYGTVRRMTDQIRPDIIHIQYDSVPYKNKKILLNFLPFFLRLQYGNTKTITTIHEFREHRLRWKARVLPMIIFSDRCIFADEWDMKTVMREFPFIGKGKLAFIPIAANIAPSNDTRGIAKAEARRRLGLPKDDVIIFHYGVISPHKGLDFLLDVFEEAAFKTEKLKLLLISDVFSPDFSRKTEYQKSLLDKIEKSNLRERYLLLGYQDEGAMSLYITAADIATFPFTFGVSYQRGGFLSCLAHGLPVVTTVTPNYPPSRIVNGRDAVLVDVNDRNLFRKKTIELIQDNKLREEIGRNAMEFYERNFSWRRIAEETVSLYKEAIS